MPGPLTPPPLPAPLYKGSANTWECDEGGHLNIRFQFERAYIGLMHAAAALAMPRAFSHEASATLVPIELHARFHREARPTAPLSMHGGLVALGDSDATLCFDMRHSDETLATSFVLRVAHADARTLKRFPWTARTRAAAQALQHPLPDYAAPRSLPPVQNPADASLARAVELGALRVGAAAVLPDQCDVFGRLRFDHLFGRISDSVPHLLESWRRDAAARGDVAPAGAVVETRALIRRMPRAGDLIDIRTGLAAIGDKTVHLVHWLCDPLSGGAWASVEATSLSFDIRTRKTITPSPKARADMQRYIIPMSL